MVFIRIHCFTLVIIRTIHVGRSLCSTQVASQSIADSNQILSPTETSPKIKAIVDEIGKLTLLEVAELNVALKEVLKIPDAPMMSFAAGAMMAGMPGDKAAKSDEDADAASKTVQTAFTLKITKFDEGKKVALIKEVKNLVEGLNLVQVNFCRPKIAFSVYFLFNSFIFNHLFFRRKNLSSLSHR